MKQDVRERTTYDAAGVRADRGRKPRWRRRTRGTLQQQEARLAYRLLVPGLLVVTALVLLPVLWNISLSLRELRLVELRDFNPFAPDVTLDNYRTVLGGSDFFELLGRTFLYAVLGSSLALLLGLWAAIILRHPFRGRSVVRGLVLFPYVVPTVAAAFLWKTMLNPQLGVANAWLSALFGIGNINFLSSRYFDMDVFGMQLHFPAAFTMVVLFEAWRSFPFAFLFLLARLQAIPEAMEEAATLDGANSFQRFIHIVLPQLRGVLAVLFLLKFIWTFNSFDEIFILTGGAAGTEVISVRIFNWLFGRSDIGAASALSIVLAVTLLVLLTLYFKYFYYREEDAS